MWFLWLWANRLNPEQFPLDSDIGLAAVIIMSDLIAILAGAGCVAEERQLGTLDWQLTQPASIRRQWSIKLAVAFCVAAILGGALPLTLARYGLTESAFFKSTDDMLKFFSVTPLLFAVAVYASSVCRNSVNAAVMALPVAGAMILLGLLPAIALAGAYLYVTADWSGMTLLAIYGLILVPVVASLLLWTAGTNFKMSVISIGRIVRQLCFLCLAVVLLSSVVSMGLLTLNTLAGYVHQESPEQAESLRPNPEPDPPMVNSSPANQVAAGPAPAHAFKMDLILMKR